MENTPDFFTLPQLARLANVSARQAVYAAESRRIEPTTRIGNARVYDRAAAALVLSTIKRISGWKRPPQHAEA